MIGDAPVKGEGTRVAYDSGAQGRGSRFRSLVRKLTAWAWEPERAVYVLHPEVVLYAQLSQAQLRLLEELFREKQAKIGRLQQAVATGRVHAPYEDMRREQPIKDAESLAQSISVLAQRAESIRRRTGREWKHSDGTVQGVPGDRPNEPTGTVHS